MATKKEIAEKQEAPTEKMVKIRLPLTKELKDDVFVSVNNRNWLIKRGVEVEVPECCAEVLRHSEDMLLYAMEYENKVASGD